MTEPANNQSGGLTALSSADRAPLAVIGLGANLENPLGMIHSALRTLAEIPGLEPAGRSSVYLTEPQGGPDGQNWYHNLVALYRCRLEPRDLLGRLLSVETGLGRQRLERWGPRVIDLDILALGDLVLDESPELIVPHPRLDQRLFVLVPLAEVAPNWRHPISGLTAAEMLTSLDPQGQGLKRLDPVNF